MGLREVKRFVLEMEQEPRSSTNSLRNHTGLSPKSLLNLMTAVWQDLKGRLAPACREGCQLNGSAFGICVIL